MYLLARAVIEQSSSPDCYLGQKNLQWMWIRPWNNWEVCFTDESSLGLYEICTLDGTLSLITHNNVSQAHIAVLTDIINYN